MASGINNIIMRDRKEFFSEKYMKRQIPFTFKNAKNKRYEAYVRKTPKEYEHCDGICEDPGEEDPRIYIKPDMSDRKEMNTMIHEMCHAFFFDEPEYKVYRYANAISSWLHQMGWRKVADPRVNVTGSKLKASRDKAKYKKAKKPPKKG
jgi:hypothetical protein